jgi:hypothetical protein
VSPRKNGVRATDLRKWCASCGHHADAHPNGPCEGWAPTGKKRCPCRGFKERR